MVTEIKMTRYVLSFYLTLFFSFKVVPGICLVRALVTTYLPIPGFV